MILADTDVLIDYLAGIQPITDQVLEYAQSDSLHTSAVTCFELLMVHRKANVGTEFVA